MITQCGLCHSSKRRYNRLVESFAVSVAVSHSVEIKHIVHELHSLR